MDETDVVAAVGGDSQKGLSSAEAHMRFLRYGPCAIGFEERPSWVLVFLGQFKDFMVLVLLAATAVSAVLGETTDAAAIAAIVVLNGVLGFIQEWRAERSLQALRKLAAPMARVVRDGRVSVIPAESVVPGDLLKLAAGDKVAADARILAADALEVDESLLTGESFPVAKRAGTTPADALLADRWNMVYMGTAVTRGSATAVVVATGMHTEVGRIADLILKAEEDQTPLQRRMENLGRWIVAACLAICGLVGGAGVARGDDPYQMFLTGVSLAVAAIPEGLPAVVTVALALGVQRMLKVNAIVRKLSAIEALGCATVICSDKTGTLTSNEMTLRMAATAGKRYIFTGSGYSPAGGVFRAPAEAATSGPSTTKAAISAAQHVPGGVNLRDEAMTDSGRFPGRLDDATDDPDLRALLLSAAICGNADLQPASQLAESVAIRQTRTKARRRPNGARPKVRPSAAAEMVPVGDPMEAAILIGALKAGFTLEEIRAVKRYREVPFEPERRRMSVVAAWPRGRMEAVFAGLAPQGFTKRVKAVVVTKGAVEALFPISTAVWHGPGRVKPLTPAEVARMESAASSMGNAGLRVIGVCYKLLTSESDVPWDGQEEVLESGLTFLGLLGLEDPVRPEAVEAVMRCSSAGIRTVMITGDHRSTAVNVAKKLGLAGGDEDAAVLSGADIDRLSDPQLARKLETARVFARVSPAHKLRLVRVLKQMGHVVAMTGDGVNDAPAIKEADIGIAMGKKGTEVSKEASDVVLADDNFATIVNAVEEGRAIYDNIRKFVHYLLSCNVGEILVMVGCVLSALPLPLVPIQILWVNLVTDGLPAMALGVDPPEPDVMRRPPRDPREGLFAGGLGMRILVEGAIIGLITLSAFRWRLGLDGNLVAARTFAFGVLVMCQLFHAWNCRSETRSIFSMDVGENPFLVAATATSAGMLYAAIQLPSAQKIFSTAALGPWEWGLVVAVGAAPAIIRSLVSRPRLRPLSEARLNSFGR